CQQYNSATVTF
nr:immunoglobulin light chain junction region [Macaca mulatta]